VCVDYSLNYEATVLLSAKGPVNKTEGKV